MAEVEVPTEETIKEELETVDGRTALGKRLKLIEDTQKEMMSLLLAHERRITECSIRR